MSLHEQTTAIPDGEVEGTDKAVDEAAVFVEYYTDPLCSWSWAFEAQWRRLRYECSGRLHWHYRMGGLIADWQSYADPFNDIRNPAQMGPQWFQVQEMSGMPLDDRIWYEDPPASSYPACVAVKAAQRQGADVAENYLRCLREAVMTECRNIARQDVLLTVAEEAAGDSNDNKSVLDLNRFRDDLTAPETLDAFRQDLRDAAYHNIGRFPTLILQRADEYGIVIVGYRPYDALCAALEHLAPGLRQNVEMPSEALAVAYVTYWKRVLARELMEVLGGDIDQTSQLLESLVVRGILAKTRDSQSKASFYISGSKENFP